MVGKRRKNVLLTHKKRWGIVCYRERWGANVCVPKNIPILFSPPLSPNTALTTYLRFSSYPANPSLIPCAAGSASNSTVGDDVDMSALNMHIGTLISHIRIDDKKLGAFLKSKM